MSGSEEKRVVHARWLSNTTRLAPVLASSPRNSRPNCGLARSIGKTAGETDAPLRVTGPSGPFHSTELSR